MCDYVRDGRIPLAWRIDIPDRYVELWKPSNVEEPAGILRGLDDFAFESVSFTVDALFVIWNGDRCAAAVGSRSLRRRLADPGTRFDSASDPVLRRTQYCGRRDWG